MVRFCLGALSPCRLVALCPCRLVALSPFPALPCNACLRGRAFAALSISDIQAYRSKLLEEVRGQVSKVVQTERAHLQRRSKSKSKSPGPAEDSDQPLLLEDKRRPHKVMSSRRHEGGDARIRSPDEDPRVLASRHRDHDHRDKRGRRHRREYYTQDDDYIEPYEDQAELEYVRRHQSDRHRRGRSHSKRREASAGRHVTRSASRHRGAMESDGYVPRRHEGDYGYGYPQDGYGEYVEPVVHRRSPRGASRVSRLLGWLMAVVADCAHVWRTLLVMGT